MREMFAQSVDPGAGQKRHRVAPPGSRIESAVAARGVMR
jgi:hypothetical protein